ncbi:MAG: hypothetical protein WDA12_05030 [Bacilli bacterium]
MIVFSKKSDKEVREAWKAHRKMEQELMGKEEEPAAVNAINALQLTSPPPLLWDGTEYRVPVVPFADGLRLQILSSKIANRDGVSLPPEEQLKVWDEASTIMWNLLSPKPKVNPFSNASPQEVGELIAFFLFVQMKWKGRSRLTLPTESQSRSTTLMQ